MNNTGLTSPWGESRRNEISLPACLRAGSLNYAENKREKWNRERERGEVLAVRGPQKGGPSITCQYVWGSQFCPSWFPVQPNELTCCFERLSSPTIPEVAEAGADSALWKECQLPFQPNGNICIGKGQSVLAKNILTGGSRRGSPHVCWKRGRCTGHRGLPKLGRARRGWGNLSARCPPYPCPGCSVFLPRLRPGPQCQRQPRDGSVALRLWPGWRVGSAQRSWGRGRAREGPRGGTCLTDGGAAGPGAAESLELALSWICLSFPVCTQGRVWAV